MGKLEARFMCSGCHIDVYADNETVSKMRDAHMAYHAARYRTACERLIANAPNPVGARKFLLGENSA